MAQKIVAVTTPATGAEFTQTVPNGEYWALLAFTARLVTSGVAVARIFKFTIDDGSTILFQVGNVSATGQTAGVTCSYSLGPGTIMETNSPGSAVFKVYPLPSGPVPLILQPGWRIRSVTENLDAGDAYSLIRAVVLADVSELGVRRYFSG